MVAFVSY
jgi:hypothetical protein